MNAATEKDILERLGGRCDVTTGVDVVFVHGAETGAKRCWHPPGHPEFSLPIMLARDLPYVCAWSLGYTSTLHRLKGHTLLLAEQAKQTIRELANQLIGRRPVVFVAHSVGGLLVKHVLRLSKESRNPERRKIIEQTKGVLFLSTPHLGFEALKLPKWIFRLPTLNRTLLADLLDQDGLRRLNAGFKAILKDGSIEVDAYYETRPSRRLLWQAQKVSKASADPDVNGVEPAPLNADHEGVCKPAGPDDHIYVSVRRFVRRCFAGPARDVFISYAHEDIDSVGVLRQHLEPLFHDDPARFWTDQSIRAGDAWRTDIVKHMESSRVAVLLLSQAFLDSEFITRTELPFLRRRADREGLHLICVPLDTVDSERLSFEYSLPEGGEREFSLNDVQWYRSPEKPVSAMPPGEKEAFFAQLARDISDLAYRESGRPTEATDASGGSVKLSIA